MLTKGSVFARAAAALPVGACPLAGTAGPAAAQTNHPSAFVDDRTAFTFSEGYGLPAFGGGFTKTPHFGFSLTKTGREVRLGGRLGLARSGSTALGFGLEATGRSPRGGGDEAERAVGFKVRVIW